MSFKKTVKIPSILGILVILVVVYLISLGTNVLFSNKSQATKNITPQNIQITNIGDNSFSVTWQTNDMATGALFVTSGTPKPQSYFDERDKQGKMNQYFSHSITVRDALPYTTYKFRIISDSKNYPINNGELSIATTGTLASPVTDIGPAYGSIKTPDNKPAIDSIVYLNFDDSQTLSTLVSDSGSWLIPINLIRNKNLQSYLSPDETKTMKISVKNPEGETYVITDTQNDSPVPEITIGKSYNFKMQAKTNNIPSPIPNLAEDASNPTKSVLGAISEKIPVNDPVVSITQPTEGATIISSTPLFQGTGIPGKVLTIIFPSVTKNLTISDDGIWKYAPDKPLGTGKQSIIVKSLDRDNKPINIKRSFEILKSGTQVLGDATPSATIIPTNIPTPTTIASISPTLRPTATPISTLSANLVPGGELPTITILLIGLTLVFGGIILAF
jgi:hypothetical protein